jgi:4-hydroxy-tetrahydrodipicolinate synthase
MPIFTGSATALVTPFNEKGVNYAALGKLIDFQLRRGADALVVLGTTGEPATMNAAEKTETARFAIEHVAKRVPVILGAGGNDTARTAEQCRIMQDAGADALLLITPYYNKCTQKGLTAHFSAAADAVKIPIILYNVPSRTGVNLLPATTARLSAHKNIAALKEASGNLEQISETLRLCGGKLDVYSGDDALTLPVMAVGGKGVISVAGNVIPDIMHDLTSACLRGDLAAARAQQLRILPLIRALFAEVNPIPVKTALNLMNLGAGILRLPLTEPEPANLELLKSELTALKLI